MISNFRLEQNKIIIKNSGEFFGALGNYEYNIGDKLYEFAIMKRDDFDKLERIYNQLIDLVSYAKECETMDIKLDSFWKMFQIVRACLEFSPYTHFYTQVLIDIIIKTYNTKIFRSDLLFKSQIGVLIENLDYCPNELYSELEENEYTPEILIAKWTESRRKVSPEESSKYRKFFQTIKELLIRDLIEKRQDLKERLELISEYSNNTLVRSLSVPEKLYLYETKKLFDGQYVNTKPAHAVFLDTKFKTKYICDTLLPKEERNLNFDQVAKIIKERHISVKEVYEIDNTEDQIRFEIFKVIQNDFTINKCQNCGRLFIPVTNSNNPNQKGRNDQKYCNNLYLNTGKTCKEIGALNQQKERINESTILTEYHREYKRMYGLHYNHPDKFNEKKFKKWSKKSKQLIEKYSDEQIEEFKQELKEFSDSIFKI
ncbi:MAG: hypothetical protein IJ220_02315 [Clostridia bacterium]|nr:hypothetical protein [Clostridia bacterium]